MGLLQSDYSNDAMMAGTHYEHKILEFIDAPEMDKQILIPDLMLRVNLDGNSDTTVFEVKTFKADKGFKVPLRYKRQVWVQMFASGLSDAQIVAYGLTDNDYINFFNEIDASRLELHKVEPNDAWIEQEFLPSIKYLKYCYDNGIFPSNEGKVLYNA